MKIARKFTRKFVKILLKLAYRDFRDVFNIPWYLKYAAISLSIFVAVFFDESF